MRGVGGHAAGRGDERCLSLCCLHLGSGHGGLGEGNSGYPDSGIGAVG